MDVVVLLQSQRELHWIRDRGFGIRIKLFCVLEPLYRRLSNACPFDTDW